MAETTSRLLTLLGLLQSHRQWRGPELADRLEVTARTLRRDIDALRELGYRIDAVRGPAGGYRLEAGVELPPLLLNADEAVTVAIGLRVAATMGLVDGELTTQTAMAKFEQLLPSAIRARVAAIASHLDADSPRTPQVSQDLLGALALACRDSERLRFPYVAGDGVASNRVVEPHWLVTAARRWFLVAWDLDRADWRTFRVDRIPDVFHTRLGFARRALPGASPAEFVARSVGAVRSRASVEVDLDAPVAAVREALGAWAATASALGEATTRWHVEGETVEHLFGALAWIPPHMSYRLSGDADVVQRLREISQRSAAATLR